MNTSIAPRMTLHDMVKSAMAEGVKNANINHEAARQLGQPQIPQQKTAAAAPPPAQAINPDHVPTDEALKLASALEYGVDYLRKQASINLPAPVGGHQVEIGKGPGALKVTETTGGGPISDNTGQAHHQPPATGLQSARGEAPTQLKNTINTPPGGGGTQQVAGHKTAAPMLAMLSPGAYYGAEKGAPMGAAGEGAVRGELGMAGGMGVGGALGGMGGAALGNALGGQTGAIIGGGLGNIAGMGLGGLGGYKLMTRKFNGPPGGAPTSDLPPEAAAAAASGEGAQKAAAPYDLILKLAAEEENKKKERQEGEGMAEAKKGLEKAEAAHKGEKENEKEGSGIPDQILEMIFGRSKTAEDAINPAHITAGPAVPPSTSAAGEPGGEPVGGAPNGPRHLIGSNESAINFTRGQAYENRKHDLMSYITEPALRSSTDPVLNNAFAHTSQAGTKVASADLQKVAAGRALLDKLAEAIGNNGAAPKAA